MLVRTWPVPGTLLGFHGSVGSKVVPDADPARGGLFGAT